METRRKHDKQLDARGDQFLTAALNNAVLEGPVHGFPVDTGTGTVTTVIQCGDIEYRS